MHVWCGGRVGVTGLLMEERLGERMAGGVACEVVGDLYDAESYPEVCATSHGAPSRLQKA